MPHTRTRYAEVLIEKALSHSPIVGVFGQRQVGKTTVLEKKCKEYRTLDKESTLREVEADPEFFIANRGNRFAIDEAQYSPRLFPALKEYVRTSKSPGQFLLSGSIRFTSRKAIRESLTGRISTVEVLPFSHSESCGQSLPNLLQSLTRVSNQKALDRVLSRKTLAKPSEFESYLVTGGLPGICFYRSPAVRAQRLEAQIDTLLNRDLRLVQNTSLPYQALRDLLEFLAKNQGLPFDLAGAVKACQISAITIKKLLFAYESLFLIRIINSTGDLSKPTYFFEDQGFSTWLTRSTLTQPQDVTRCLYANLRQELHYRPELNGRIYQFRTKHDVEIPLVFDAEQVKVGILATLDSALKPKTLASGQAFLKKHPHSKCVIAYSGSAAIVRSENLFLIPYSWLI